MSTSSTDALLAYLAEPEPVGPESSEDIEAYQDAASVLAAIADPEHLKPVGVAAGGDAMAILANDFIPATGRKFRGQVMLAPEIRYQAISRLADRGAIDIALEANPDERKGPIQDQLERYLRGTAPPLEDQTLAQLDATHQVAIWLRDAVPGVPTEEAVKDRAAYLRLLAPFEAVAGDHIFRGRKDELDDLREYIGVVQPASLLRRLRGKAFNWAEPKRKPALSIHGPGGVGKSALIARFMLEHTRLPEPARIPFAYLDFDRSALDVGDPYGLIVEMIRQLDIQFPGDRFDAIRTFAEEHWAHQDPADESGRYRAAQSLLADVLGMMSGLLGPRPYVVVLDTFEEVQYRGESRAFPLWEMLDRLQTSWRFLRVVVSGRAPVDTLRLGGKPPKTLLVGDLDTDAAVAFLGAQGVADEAFARVLVKRYGGIPLTLKLVASVLLQDPDALRGDDAPARHGGLFVTVADEVIQGQLYDRVLSHIRDEPVRRLAHPGLVLRRITPEVILEVLDGPCELGLSTLEEAKELFDGLGRETSLVSIDEFDGALVHRSDLRRVMLKLLVASEPARIEQIRRKAIEYYDHLPGRRGTAEAAYHRLHLGDYVDESVLKDTEVRSSIQSSIVEFPIAVQLRLSTLGFQVSDEALRQASQEQQEQAIAALVEEYLPNGPSSEREAQRVLASIELGLDHASPLFRSAARVALQIGDPEAAAGWIDRGLEQAAAGNATMLTLRLLQERAWLETVTQSRATPETLASLAAYAGRHDDGQAIIQHRLHGFEPGGPDETAALGAFAELLAEVPPADIWGLAPATRDVVDSAVERRHQPLLAAIQRQVVHESGPFRFAGFADPGTQARVDGVLSPDIRPIDFGMAFLDLLAAWPYRILFVETPYARRGEILQESRA